MLNKSEYNRVRHTVCKAMNVSEAEYDSTCKRDTVARARQVAWYAIRFYRPNISFEAIGRMFGKDGGTIWKACTITVPNEMETNPHTMADYTEIIKDLAWLSKETNSDRARNKVAIVGDLRRQAQRLCSGNAAYIKGTLLQIAANIEVLL